MLTCMILFYFTGIYLAIRRMRAIKDGMLNFTQIAQFLAVPT